MVIIAARLSLNSAELLMLAPKFSQVHFATLPNFFLGANVFFDQMPDPCFHELCRVYRPSFEKLSLRLEVDITSRNR